MWNETAQFIQVIWVFGKSESFSGRGWTLILREVHLICPSGKIEFEFRKGDAYEVEIVDYHRG